MRWSRRFGLTAVAVTVGLVALLLVLSMVRAPWSEAPGSEAPWSEAPAGQTVVVPMPPLAMSPEPGRTPGGTPAPTAPLDIPEPPRDTFATAALPTQPDLPDGLALLPLESIGALKRSTAEWESRSVPAAPAATLSQSPIGDPSARLEQPVTVPVQSGRASPQAEDDAAKPGPAARLHVASAASTADVRPALPAGEIRIFIHHVADQEADALARRLADYLRREGFTVADIRSVGFTIGEPSVRYFFARDRAASQRLVEELARFPEGGTSLAPDHASDFTHFLPKPSPGNVEVWLPSS